MRLLAGLAATLMFCSIAVAAEAPKKTWEAKGFAQPESVVFDAETDALYLSNIVGQPMQKDGNGFISKLKPDGTLIEREWVTGFDAPTGLAIVGGTLYVADTDQLVAIDTASGKIGKRYSAEGAKFLNDVAAGPDGAIYVSDMPNDTIWRLKDGSFEPWLKDEALNGPNGLVVQGDDLIVAQFGDMPEEGKDAAKGSLVAVSLSDKAIRKLGDGTPIGHLDGIEPFEPGVYLVTDWADGALHRIDDAGKVTRLLDTNQGSADLTYLAKEKIVIIPMMVDGTLAAYELQ